MSCSRYKHVSLYVLRYVILNKLGSKSADASSAGGGPGAHKLLSSWLPHSWQGRGLNLHSDLVLSAFLLYLRPQTNQNSHITSITFFVTLGTLCATPEKGSLSTVEVTSSQAAGTLTEVTSHSLLYMVNFTYVKRIQ